MGAHLIDGEFQSDKYPTTPRGKVPLSVRDLRAQDLLWEYAQRHRSIDAEFSDDLESALRAAGFELPTYVCFECQPSTVTVASSTEFGTPVPKCVRCGKDALHGCWIVRPGLQ